MYITLITCNSREWYIDKIQGQNEAIVPAKPLIHHKINLLEFENYTSNYVERLRHLHNYVPNVLS